MSLSRARGAAAVAVARVAGVLSRRLGLGAGEQVPGRIAERLAPGIGGALARGIANGVVLVSGTNGKTTTATLLRAAAEANGLRCAGNRGGANMMSGLTAALMEQRDAQIAVFEVDEAWLPRAIRELQPRVVVITNVFRDQLDRFGEPERVAELFARATAQLPDRATVVVNADDPALSRLRAGITFGIDVSDPVEPSAGAEPETCPTCSSALDAKRRTLAHLGSFSCARCGWHSPEPNVVVAARSDRYAFEGRDLTTRIGGRYNAYNVAAAIAAANALKFDRAKTLSAIEACPPPFGRREEITVDGARATVMLAKNPAGTDAVLAEIDDRYDAVVIAVSDLAADGRDISWIWDADFERLAGDQRPVVASGRRAEEVALRLHYAGVDTSQTQRDEAGATKAAAGLGARNIAVVATYTSMLRLRATLFGRSSATRNLS